MPAAGPQLVEMFADTLAMLRQVGRQQSHSAISQPARMQRTYVLLCSALLHSRPSKTAGVIVYVIRTSKCRHAAFVFGYRSCRVRVVKCSLSLRLVPSVGIWCALTSLKQEMKYWSSLWDSLETGV